MKEKITPLTTDELNLFNALIDLSKDRMAGRICNDFNIEKYIPSPEDRRRLVKESHIWNGDPEEFDDYCEDETFDIWYDWIALSFLNYKVNLALKSQNEALLSKMKSLVKVDLTQFNTISEKGYEEYKRGYYDAQRALAKDIEEILKNEGKENEI